MSKQPISGLTRVTRDWTSNSQREEELDSDVISWSPSPPALNRRSGTETRLQTIEAALKEPMAPSEQVLSSSTVHPLPHTSSLSTSQKRRADPVSQPALKKQRLSDTSKQKPSSTDSSYPTTSRFYNKENVPVTVVSSSSAKVVTRPAGIFLSPEQKHILQLVQDGKSVFYTGSAGGYRYHIL
jgi:hypothetical protein